MLVTIYADSIPECTCLCEEVSISIETTVCAAPLFIPLEFFFPLVVGILHLLPAKCEADPATDHGPR